ncbi:MAG: helix-turn-helix domain-containing protein [Lachnospiraceae bacterium]|nr:helix-turn-helix domain-containing protein [Bacteroides fragilis]MCM1219011.1 helix-turn-helix domain-containing protein [Lachnospiraceae bacterium]
MMKNRLKEIRKSFPEYGKNQETFAKFLGIPQSNLASYEIGRRTPTDAVIQLICQKCNVNEEWLRTGKGEPTIKRTRNQEIGAFANEVMNLPDENIKKRLIEALLKLDERDWETIEKIVESLKGDE